jgi:hypothetical protein
VFTGWKSESGEHFIDYILVEFSSSRDFFGGRSGGTFIIAWAVVTPFSSHNNPTARATSRAVSARR